MGQVPITSESKGTWNHYFVYPFSLVLIFFADLFQGSYGLAIVMVTIIIRLLLLPLFLKQQKSTLAIKQLQPEMEALKNKFDLKKQEQMQRYQQAIMRAGSMVYYPFSSWYCYVFTDKNEYHRYFHCSDEAALVYYASYDGDSRDRIAVCALFILVCMRNIYGLSISPICAPKKTNERTGINNLDVKDHAQTPVA